ncbi:uncharacterized protein CLUP02_11784 [Colletotrichum lupini]|uniref:Uncharacterized protein n=1 Tax=Colletotrichum lupini TaxID=145971 RepID=A0A9Q8SZ70_9PEZI|nr:uncharacterized protein CLUP02_11784 [Colletotrichum lupini]UQC86284.1 hypothetical protein CLUP02_11784 [Colletotrichum lupini]
MWGIASSIRWGTRCLAGQLPTPGKHRAFLVQEGTARLTRKSPTEMFLPSTLGTMFLSFSTQFFETFALLHSQPGLLSLPQGFLFSRPHSSTLDFPLRMSSTQVAYHGYSACFQPLPLRQVLGWLAVPSTANPNQDTTTALRRFGTLAAPNAQRCTPSPYSPALFRLVFLAARRLLARCSPHAAASCVARRVATTPVTVGTLQHHPTISGTHLIAAQRCVVTSSLDLNLTMDTRIPSLPARAAGFPPLCIASLRPTFDLYTCSKSKRSHDDTHRKSTVPSMKFHGQSILYVVPVAPAQHSIPSPVPRPSPKTSINPHLTLARDSRSWNSYRRDNRPLVQTGATLLHVEPTRRRLNGLRTARSLNASIGLDHRLRLLHGRAQLPFLLSWLLRSLGPADKHEVQLGNASFASMLQPYLRTIVLDSSRDVKTTTLNRLGPAGFPPDTKRAAIDSVSRTFGSTSLAERRSFSYDLAELTRGGCY